MTQLQRPFYAHNACQVAQQLLGKRLVRLVGGQRVAGIIVETEAYCASDEADLACHGTRNQGKPTKRTAIMFGAAGFVYVYLNYGIHWLFNIVTGDCGQASAVLVRALEPVEGESFMHSQRAAKSRQQLTNGPGKLSQALAIDASFYGADLCAASSQIWIEPDWGEVEICSGARIGLGKTPEPWFSMPWRYWIAGNAFVSDNR